MDVGDALLVGFIVGVVCGLAPLISGFLTGRVGLGVAGLVVTAISGALLGLLLAVPVAIVFTLAVWFMRPERTRPRRHVDAV